MTGSRRLGEIGDARKEQGRKSRKAFQKEGGQSSQKLQKYHGKKRREQRQLDIRKMGGGSNRFPVSDFYCIKSILRSFYLVC